MKTILFFVSGARLACGNGLSGVYRYAREVGWHVQLIERVSRKMDIRRQLTVWQPAGVIVECGGEMGWLDPKVFGDLPVVYLNVDRSSRRFYPRVSLDDGEVGRLAARHLLSLGLDHYAFVAFRRPLSWVAERMDAFAAEVTRAGKGCAVFDPGREQPLHVRHRNLVRWLEFLPRPCGVFAANDITGEELVNLCAGMGLSVPDEVAILGADDFSFLCENVSPTLSSIELDFGQGGYMAAACLARLMAGETVPRRSEMRFSAVRVVTRQSTRRMARDHRQIAAVCEKIRRGACRGMSAAEVVAMMGEPRRTAEVHFREVVGRTIHEEIDAVRFEKIFELLRRPRQRLSGMPELCGFRTMAGLRKAFRLKTGESMRAWRKRNGVEAPAKK